MTATARVKRTFTYHGKRYYVSGKTEEEAIAKREQLKMELRLGLRSEGGMTIEQLSQMYLRMLKNSRIREETKASKKTLIRRYILPKIGFMKVSDVKPIHVIALLDSDAQVHSDAHVRHIKTVLNDMFKVAISFQLCAVNPVSNIITPHGMENHRHREATTLERNLCLGHYLWLDMCILCGLRLAEPQTVTFGDVHTGYMHVHGTKTRQADRYVPLPRWLYNRIMEVPHTFDGEPVCKKSYNSVLAKQLMMVKKSVGIQAEDLTAHCFRHSYVTDLENCQGLSVAQIKTIAGHSMSGITDTYTHTRADTAKDALEPLIKYWSTHGLFPSVIAAEKEGVASATLR